MRALTVKQSRQILQVSKPTFYQLIKSGALTAFRVGSHWRISEEALIAFTKGGQK